MPPSRIPWTLTCILMACGGGGDSTTESSVGTVAPSTSTNTGPGVTDGGTTTTGDTSPTNTTTSATPTSSTSTTSSTPTSGGDSGSSGPEPTGGGGEGGFCQEACRADADCMIDGVDAGYVCNGARCRPGGMPDECNSDLFCQIVGPTGLTFCEAPGDCAVGRVCVALEGFSQGACSPLSDGMGGGCLNVNYEAATLPLLGGGEAEVCIAPTAFCDKENGFEVILYCNVKPEPCREDAQCNMYPTQPVCSAGACVCTEDAHCAGVAGLSTCVDGRCACVGDQDCAGLTGADTCVDGVCGCGSAAACPGATAFDGTAIVCEPL